MDPAFLLRVCRFFLLTGAGCADIEKVYEEGRAHDIISSGVAIIGSNDRVKWHKIRAEYIGGASQSSLSRKYGVSRSVIAKHCRNESWTDARKTARAEVEQKVIQKTADLAADNATIAAGIKRKGLMLLDKLFDEYMNLSVTEHQESGPGTKDIKRLRDLTAAYKDLTGDLAASNNSTNELLQSLIDLERGRDD